MPPVLERTIRPYRSRISVNIPREYGNFTYRVVMIPIADESAKRKYDFSQFVGKLKWKGGDPVAFQRRIRDEW